MILAIVVLLWKLLVIVLVSKLNGKCLTKMFLFKLTKSKEAKFTLFILV